MEPGDEIKTCIRYDHETGSITVSIAIMKDKDKEGDNDNSGITKVEDHEKRSEIVVLRTSISIHISFRKLEGLL